MTLRTFAAWEVIPTISVPSGKSKFRHPSDPVSTEIRDEIDFIVIVKQIPESVSKQDILERLSAIGYRIQSDHCGFEKEFPDGVHIAFRSSERNVFRTWEDLV